jgi:uncharacterized protein
LTTEFNTAEHPLERRGERLILHVRVTPKASRARLGGTQVDVAGRHRLRVAVTAVPEGGKANSAVLKAIAKALGWPQSSLSMVAGDTDRNKQIEVIQRQESAARSEADLIAAINHLALSSDQ